MRSIPHPHNLKKLFAVVFFLLFFAQVPAQTQHKIDSLNALVKKAASDTDIVRLQNRICKLLIQDGEPQKSLDISLANIARLKKVFETRSRFSGNDELNFRNHYGDVYLITGLAYGDISNFEKAKENLLKAVREYSVAGNKAGVARAYNNLGNREFETGRYSDAIKYHFASLKIAEELGNRKGMASSLNNMANVYGSQGKNKEAIGKYFEALAIYKEVEYPVGVGNANNNIALVYDQLGNFDSAAFYIRKSYEIRLAINDKAGIASCLANLGVFNLEQKKFNEALKYFQQSLKAKKELQDLAGEGSEYKNIATVLVYLNRPAEAIENGEKALEIARQVGALDDLKSAYSVCSMAYSKSGQYEKAYEYQNLFVEMSDSIQAVNNARIITEMNTKYQTEKKEKENQLLQTKNQLSTAAIRQQKIITWLVIGGLLITVFLAFFIFKGLKQQRKANSIISLQKQEVEKQKDLVEEKQKEIIDSINYAKRIQSSLLANRALLSAQVPEHFIFFKPKDIVSGDFYWAASVRSSELPVQRNVSSGEAENYSAVITNNSQLFYLAVCDSTGHGVPGAFMSLLNIGFLSEAIKEKGLLKPNEVFNYVRQRLVESISQEGQKDGFDGVLLCIDKTNGKITYAAANNNPVIVSNHRLINLPADSMPVGKGERDVNFELYEMNVQPGDTIYLFTDGYPDQFGGPKGKKFKYKQLEEILVQNSHLPMNEQSVALEKRFNEWKGNLEQIDDVLVIGIKM